jgi:hypothetical protein
MTAPRVQRRALCIGIRDVQALTDEGEEDLWPPVPYAHDDVDRIVDMLQRTCDPPARVPWLMLRAIQETTDIRGVKS